MNACYRAAAAAALLVLSGLACQKRQASLDERVQIAQWQSMVVAVRDPEALAALRTRAANNNVVAQSALGQALLKVSDTSLRKEGLEWLEQAAKSRDAQAQFVLGRLAFFGSAETKQDYKKARERFELAALADPRASYYLGLMNKGGYGGPVNLAAAAKHFEVAAVDIPAAMFLLANAYREGAGVTQDLQRAVALYERAAEKDHPESIQTLAMAYRDGDLGVQRDHARYEAQLAELAHALRHAPTPP